MEPEQNPQPTDNPRETAPLEPMLAAIDSSIPQSPAIAPAWHTVVLVAAILAVSAHGASRIAQLQGSVSRLPTYALTAAMELALLAWVAFGLRLKKIPLRTLLGQNVISVRAIAIDCGIAMLFWIGSLIVLGSLGIAWLQIQSAITHRPLIPQAGQTVAPDPAQQQALRAIKQLAPANPREMGIWALLCVLVGFIEEIVFRGYLQRQFTAWARGATVWGVALSAIVFGAAHGYQGLRNMVLLSVFGALFSVLVLSRRSLRSAIIAHSWHDLIFGLLLALLNSQHLI